MWLEETTERKIPGLFIPIEPLESQKSLLVIGLITNCTKVGDWIWAKLGQSRPGRGKMHNLRHGKKQEGGSCSLPPSPKLLRFVYDSGAGLTGARFAPFRVGLKNGRPL